MRTTGSQVLVLLFIANTLHTPFQEIYFVAVIVNYLIRCAFIFSGVNKFAILFVLIYLTLKLILNGKYEIFMLLNKIKLARYQLIVNSTLQMEILDYVNMELTQISAGSCLLTCTK